jgi:hypothetical protein
MAGNGFFVSLNLFEERSNVAIIRIGLLTDLAVADLSGRTLLESWN